MFYALLGFQPFPFTPLLMRGEVFYALMDACDVLRPFVGLNILYAIIAIHLHPLYALLHMCVCFTPLLER